ncbi:unnamed protein product [Vitrella brassicaformis CCMP3155]|uniref:Mitochondrial carrier protein n=2 Tax=Vitrella brassicaformis TaxID=1169539 RepID=A0A0G4EBV7_VITBC|nr:unnamed protein product [Vitrella brassicaformis CCMP3155]|eukprot:CEL93135.1 unnamed protein product [Vitrella brassicaformis CCMP3155]
MEVRASPSPAAAATAAASVASSVSAANAAAAASASASRSAAAGSAVHLSLEERVNWEEWKGEDPFWLHALCGSIAGCTEHIAMFPIDTLKTRVQALQEGSGITLSQAFRSILTERGWKGLFRGLGAVTSGCIPAHASLFCVYEVMKDRLGIHHEGHFPVRAMLCGATATFSHDFIMTPMDVVKQRMQLGCYRSMVDCFVTVVRSEGIASFFRSVPTTVLMNIPYGAMFVAVNESMKEALGLSSSAVPHAASHTHVAGHHVHQHHFDSDHHHHHHRHHDHQRHPQHRHDHSAAASASPPPQAPPAPSPADATSAAQTAYALPLYFLAAGLSGGFASAITTPLDSCECSATGEQAINVAATDAATVTLKYQDFLSTSRTIWVEEGLHGFCRGMLLRSLQGAPSAALCWGTYEALKFVLGSLFQRGQTDNLIT